MNFCSIAQFPIYFNSTNTESINSIAETNNGNFITLISNEDGLSDELMIHVYNSSGNVLGMYNYPTSDEVYELYGNLYEVNRFYFVIGYIWYDAGDVQVYMLKLDSAFNKVGEYIIGDTDKQEYVYGTIIDSDSNIVVCGWEYLSGSPFIKKIDLNGNILEEKIYDVFAIFAFTSIIENKELNEYLVANHPWEVYYISKDSLTIDSVKQVLDTANLNITVRYIYPFDSSYDFILTTQELEEVEEDEYLRRVHIQRLNENCEIGWDVKFSDTSDIVIVGNAFEASGDSLIWAAITPVREISAIFFEATNHTISVYKIDATTGDTIKRVHLGGDANYVAVSVEVTGDGSVLIGASKYDWTKEDFQLDGIIWKIDAEGNFVTQIEAPEIVNNFTVFPNPVTDYVQILSPLISKADVHIFNVAGQLISTFEIIPGSNSVNLKYLEPGFYVMNIVNKNGGVQQSARFIKM